MALAASHQRQQWRWAFSSGVFGTFLGALLGAEYASANEAQLALEEAFAASSGGGLISAAVGAFTYHLLYKS